MIQCIAPNVSEQKTINLYKGQAGIKQLLWNIVLSKTPLVIGFSPGQLEFVTDREKNLVVIKAKNAIRHKTEKDDSTQLGLVIIKQLILDNFGKESKIHVEKNDKEYCLTLVFPLFKESENLNYDSQPILT